MTPPPADFSNLRAELLEQTHLGRMCSSKQLLCDRYEVRKLVGHGGFGVTFLSRDTKLPGTPVCIIKQLSPKVRDPRLLEKARQRFEQEAKILGQLGTHSQIPHLLNYFEIEGEFYLVQEYVRGLTLSKSIRRGGVWSEEQVKQFLKAFLPVLHYVHSNHVIHRDIKPSNILHCHEDGRLVLIDFGAVKEKVMTVDPATCRTFSTHFIGTVGFAPPEQLSLRSVFATDLYALGMTCLFLLTGKPPLEFDYEPRTGEILWQGDVQVSDYFGRVLARMLKASLKERYQSADEVFRALELESHVQTLLPCMSNQPLAPVAEPPHPKEFVSPIIRTANAIREWQARLEAKRIRDGERRRRMTKP
ncbi:serine/threonine-protein kinase [Myxacorys almedinensis]|uniref:non-specific serine/threonine protein kinase n=1 Tax=Myxacorys almedinensis A TaxID=2690445 RepID=A0A8J8CI15_9CYAN|nr:serine/threonine-protein kinase [Myxacorys almedinensis]NDJ17283.1 protein kinase [Myxacorys almedinensis A]